MSFTAAKKRLGQHWLHDEAALNAIVDIASLKKNDTVLEIGPGTGTLTKKILAKDVKLTALELDESLIPKLQHEFPSATFLNVSVLKFNLSSLSRPYKVVANIPYYLTSHLLRVLSESKTPPVSATLLVQKEVAQRIAARPGMMSLLSVSTQFYFTTTLGRIVPAKLFEPKPKVDSQIIHLVRREIPLFEVDASKYFELVKAGFSARRKKLRSSLSGGLHISKKKTEILCERAGIDSNARAQDLSLKEWFNLYEEYSCG